MLDRIESKYFSPWVGRTCQAWTATGETLVLKVESVKEHPSSRPPETRDSHRVPFSVALTALGPTEFCEGCCRLELETVGSLEGVRLVRVAALGRDASRAYFQIVFN